MVSRLMSKAEVAIERFLDKKGIKYYCPGEPVFIFDLTDKSGKIYSFFIEIKDGDYYTVEVTSCICINPNDKGQLFRALDLFNRLKIEPGFRHSTFFVDPDSGVIKHLQKTDCFNSEPSEDVINKSLLIPQIEFELINQIIRDYVFDSKEVDISLSIALSMLNMLK